MSESNIVLPTLTSGSGHDPVAGVGLGVVRLAYGVRVDTRSAGRRSRTQINDRRVGRDRTWRDGVSRSQVRTMVCSSPSSSSRCSLCTATCTRACTAARHLDRIPDGRAASYGAGYVGMWLAVKGNVRSATPRSPASRTRWNSHSNGRIRDVHPSALDARRDDHLPGLPRKPMKVLVGFGFGGFARRTVHARRRRNLHQGADVAATCRQNRAGPARRRSRQSPTIADNVGDNVGDCAGMAADVFESTR